MGQKRIIRILLASTLLAVICFCTSCNTAGQKYRASVHFPSSTLQENNFTSESYNILGKVTGCGEASSSKSPNTGMDEDQILNIAKAHATYSMVDQARNLGADFLLFPNYMVEFSTGGTITVEASAIAAALMYRQ